MFDLKICMQSTIVTLNELNINGRMLCISKAGMTTLVNVSLNRVSFPPRVLSTILLSCFPSYNGPIIDKILLDNGNINLQQQKLTEMIKYSV